MNQRAWAAMLGLLVGCLVCPVASAQPREGDASGSRGAAEATKEPTPQPIDRPSTSVPANKPSTLEPTDVPTARSPVPGAVAEPVAGYSWKEGKRTAPTRRFRVPAVDWSKPVATYPGFMMLPDGRSTVWVQVNRAVDVSVERRGRTVVVTLPTVQVSVLNNTNPLVTAHFPTPLVKAHLRRTTPGAQLVLEFREEVQVHHEVLSGPRGMMTLRVIVPRSRTSSSRSAVVPGAGTPTASESGRRQRP